MKHYKNLMSALGDAMPVCLAWRLNGSEDNYFNARDLFAFALADDNGEGALKEGQFYLVSAEGAIGIASGYEYFVRWLFIPLEGDTYEREVLRLKAELERDAQPEPVASTVPEPVPEPVPQPAPQPQPVYQPAPEPAPQSAWDPQPTPQSAPQPQTVPQQPAFQSAPQSAPQPPKVRFCRNCGSPISPNAKFCSGCGNPIAR